MALAANRILVVDDEAVIRELLTDILSEEGWVVESASCGPTALTMMDAPGEYMVLFTDIMMPDMNGIELIREARSRKPSIIPIVMTGFATLDTARDAVREGAYDYVLKPFSLSEVKTAVSNALERFRLASENARLLELTELFNISEKIAAMRSEARLLDFLLEAALQRVECDRGSVMLTTADGMALDVATSRGLPNEAGEEALPMGEGIAGLVAQQGRPLLVEDVRRRPELTRRARGLDEPSFISVPLERRHPADPVPGGVPRKPGPPVLAVLNVAGKADGMPFSESDLKALSILANHGAVALENVRLIEHIERAHIETLRSMVRLLEARDAYTRGHSERVSRYSVQIAEVLGVCNQDIETLRLGALLHDLGKIGVSDLVLNKEGRLTDEEWEAIRQHPVIGYEILLPVSFLNEKHLALVRSHHEKLDGRGYPDGLTAPDIPELVRIISVADAYDAMSSRRAYRRPLELPEIIAELRRCAGNQFDPRVVEAFIALLERGKLQTEPLPVG